ncbi:hypothetical protein OIU85_006202 [Salix viminalis]|uniref:K-box domain-containing protein n=1 Tax=Salix viminalis TaxID=40686 RepID=A0A9Q0SUF1_SALVM|nr:hypothetical protein OIU85_006202 [Salix viminalis]
MIRLEEKKLETFFSHILSSFVSLEMSYRNCTHPENVTYIYLLRRTVVLSNSMEKILERYERCSYAERQSVSPDLDSQGNWTLEYNMLKAKVELLQRNHRHYLGEDLDSVSLKELQNLEQQIDTALKHIRARKNHLMFQSISELQIKIKEKEKALAQLALRDQQNDGPNPSSFFSPQPPLPCLNIRYQEEDTEARRNELDLTLEPIYSCHPGCFGT